MKKKAIEKIPYLGLKRISRGQDVKYIGVTALKVVGHEEHLFLEMYRNEKGSMDIPVVRIALTKKDFGIYYPDQDIWTREKIAQDYYYGATLVWDKAGGRTERNARAKSNILATEEDMQRIEKFCGENGYKSEWWEHIYRFQSSIVYEERRRRENRKYERRQQALKDRQEHTPELPEAEILEMADRLYLHQKPFLYYKKRGCRVRIACTKCGGVTEARWKGGISYESQYQKWVDPPKEGDLAPCPMCGDRYLGKHNDGQTYILMLRFAKEPEIPYITVEIERDTHQLIQWYGAHDHKPDEEHMQKWLDDYVRHLKQKDAEAKQRAQSVA